MFGDIFLITARLRWSRDADYYLQAKWRGTWKLDANILSYTYSSPNDTIRYYKITIFDDKLILNENGINFSFKKEAVVSPIASSGSSIKSFSRGLLGIFSLLMLTSTS